MDKTTVETKVTGALETLSLESSSSSSAPTVAAAAATEEEKPLKVFVCNVKDFHGERHSLLAGEREIVVFRVKGEYYALDGRCYHAGGPLSGGHLMEIEDLDHRPCIACPWHGYKIMLDNGESIYRAADPRQPLMKPRSASKGLKQRVHPTLVEDGKLYVVISTEGKRDSDYYSSEDYLKLFRGRRQKMMERAEQLG